MSSSYYRWTLRTSVLFLLAYSAAAQSGNDGDPLFASHDVLNVTITAPFSSLMRDRPNEEYLPATFRYQDSAGDTIEFSIGIRTRGRLRRNPDICAFAPLRLNFKKSQTKDTLFDHQDKLKLVTHCQNNNARYRQGVLKEYLAYRILNLMTDVSYRVRLLDITYVDTDKKNRARVSFAFFIEHANRFAKRIDAPALKISKAKLSDLQPEHTNLGSVFQYFIGNTDFSPLAADAGENCCHNYTLFAREGELYFSVPYDFDMSGIVYTDYSAPNKRFRLRNVTERLYRGRCANNSHLPASLERFTEQRDTINELINTQDLLTKGARKTVLNYVDRFYRLLDSQKKIQKELFKSCI
ncbi:MAG: hypothetical protein IIA07_03510 [Proteobacteria bacterium]|nr:hypothetical protein [Pseudomonadota bacterium]